MENLQDWFQSFVTSNGFMSALSSSITAILVLIIGIILAAIIRKLLKAIIKKAKIKKKIADSPVGTALGDYSITSVFIDLFYIYLLLIVVQQSVSFLKLNIVSYYVGQIANLFPDFVYGVIIIVVGFVIGEYVKYYLKRSSILFKDWIASASKFFIVFFFLIMAFPHFKLDPTIIMNAFNVFLIAFAFAIALGFGLAIGLGAKDTVAEIMKNKRKNILDLVGAVEEKVKKKK